MKKYIITEEQLKVLSKYQNLIESTSPDTFTSENGKIKIIKNGKTYYYTIHVKAKVPLVADVDSTINVKKIVKTNDGYKITGIDKEDSEDTNEIKEDRVNEILSKVPAEKIVSVRSFSTITLTKIKN
jgi:hypothetical protein